VYCQSDLVDICTAINRTAPKTIQSQTISREKF